MAQKAEQKAEKEATISAKTQEYLQAILAATGGSGGKNKFGHLINRAGGFIDEQLEQGKGVDEIVAEWATQHRDKKPISPARVVDEIKHLLAEHNFKVEVEKGQQVKPKKVQG